MAVKEANSIYKSFIFNGVSAADYGVYVTDVNVFNSAERAVEYITIPGRNGSFALDHGRFENIIVEYECALGQDTDVDFATAISDFRNALAAAKGYQRLEDDMNPDEYRMAVFSKGLDAPTLNQQTATFKVEFNCKPQRYLKSGETAVSVESGDTITNPTLFESRPLLQVWGYGNIGINDDTVTISDDVIGETILQNSARDTASHVNTKLWQVYLNTEKLRTGDTIKVSGAKSEFGINAYILTAEYNISTGDVTPIYTGLSVSMMGVKFPDLEFTLGTAKTYTARWTCRATLSGGATREYTTTSQVSISAAGRVSFYVSVAPTTVQTEIARLLVSSYESIVGYSTKSALGEPLYFDLDIGEAYKEEDGAIVSVNNAVSFPAKLPVLKPGENTITFENTVDQLKLVPRWWKV